MSPRAAIVVTGSELVRGDRHDRNGPFLAEALLRLGIEPARITVVGDALEAIEQAIREGLEHHDLVVISGGLGPTHDDRTVEALAAASGRALVHDEELHAQIEQRSRAAAERLGRPFAEFADGVRKQATKPVGAEAVGLAGTAPALVLDTGSAVAVVLPGPPRELQALWPRVLERDAMRSVLARAEPADRRVLRFYGVPESTVARALADAGGEGDGVEITICARDFEIHVDLLPRPGAEARADAVGDALAASMGDALFGRSEASVEELVLDACRAHGWTLATAESCTGGLVAARLTSVPGSSDVVAGGIVSYANAVKERELGVPAATLERFGAVSPETTAAMAHGVRERLAVDVAVAITGIAGPGGGTPAKPVGLVYLHAVTPTGERAVRLDTPGDRETIRLRATVAALHLVRTLVTEL